MPLTPGPVYEAFWKFAAERQRIFHRRALGMRPPWTQDPILQEYKFTNAYRAADRVSQYLIRNVIHLDGISRDDSLFTNDEVFFRIILFKMFNRIETWKALCAGLEEGVPTSYDLYRGYVPERIEGLIESGRPVYTSAYMTPSPPKHMGDKKHLVHFDTLQQMMKDRLPDRIAGLRSMKEGYGLLREYPMIGDFLAYQFVTDLCYSDNFNFSEMEFVVPGPGAKDGIRKCFPDRGAVSDPDIIRMVCSLQETEPERFGVSFQDLFGRPLQLIDVQNCFCEVSKYSRVSHPEVKGLSGRSNIKAKFTANHAEPIDYFFPPKWGINGNIPKRKDARDPSQAET